MRMIRRLAPGGLVKRLMQEMDETRVQAVMIYADDGALDEGGYDDPHRDTRDPEMTKDLTGWESCGKPFLR